jgi:uncharacterized protein YrrD
MIQRRGWTYRGVGVVDAAGKEVGTVTDVWPADGGGEPELVLVKVGRRFRRTCYLPLDGRVAVGDDKVLKLPWSRTEIDEAPSAEDHRWGDPAHVARAYWRDSTD